LVRSGRFVRNGGGPPAVRAYRPPDLTQNAVQSINKLSPTFFIDNIQIQLKVPDDRSGPLGVLSIDSYAGGTSSVRRRRWGSHHVSPFTFTFLVAPNSQQRYQLHRPGGVPYWSPARLPFRPAAFIPFRPFPPRCLSCHCSTKNLVLRVAGRRPRVLRTGRTDAFGDCAGCEMHWPLHQPGTAATFFVIHVFVSDNGVG